MYETSCQSRFDARYWMLGAGALGRPRGMVWGGRREESSRWGTHVYLWRIHFDIWQNQSNIVKFKNKIKKKEPTCQSRRQKGLRFNPWVGKIHWRKAWQSIPVFLPGKSHGQRSLVGYSPQGRTESDTTEAT